MATAKIEIKVGKIEFSAEGDQKWVTQQLEEMVGRIPELTSKTTDSEATTKTPVKKTPDIRGRKRSPGRPRKTAAPVVETPVATEEAPKEVVAAVKTQTTTTRKRKTSSKGKSRSSAQFKKSDLGKFIKANDGDKNQIRKFLLTAIFLHNGGKTTLKTGDINAALVEAGDKKLSNASDALNKNVGKGYCSKNGREFSLTEAGLAEAKAA
ncbi:MAG: hypothetical protein AAF399_09415 [Bacteroidota bacterium]